MAFRARIVIGADVDEACMTWRKGLSNAGESKPCISNYLLAAAFGCSNGSVIPLQLDSSWRRRPKPAISGLSCMLFPFFPRNPHRFATPMSCVPSTLTLVTEPLLPGRRSGLGGPSWTGFGLPPKMEDTEEPAQRACLRIADVTDIHSDTTNETGSTATDTGRLLYCVLDERALGLTTGRTEVLGRGETSGLPRAAASAASIVALLRAS